MPVAAGKYYVAITYTPGCELTVSGSSIATGIVAVGSKAQKSSAVYNLAGQRVNAEMKGIHIVNGKVVIVK